MRSFTKAAARLLCGAALATLLPLAASAASTHVVYSFTGGADGAEPFPTLTPDSFGNLYGTTQGAGAQPYPNGYGTIFKLDPSGALTTLYAFQGGALGDFPETGVSLIRGQLYGNAPLYRAGGPPGGTSVLYSIGTDGSNYTVLHTMTGGQGKLLIGLLQPAPGGEFGLGQYGGPNGRGTLFYLGAHDQFEVVHDFAGGSDGQAPTYLVEDSAGNLYGSTGAGGNCTAVKHGCGVIFEYAPATRAYSILYTFQGGQDGSSPLLGAVGPDGTLYGVSTQGGANNHGALFALTPANGAYTFSILSPIISHYHPSDHANNPPALSPDGALVGGTVDAEYYQYQNGQYTNFFDKVTQAQSQFTFLPKLPNTFFATSTQGGTGSACAYGCGIIYYVTQ